MELGHYLTTYMLFNELVIWIYTSVSTPVRKNIEVQRDAVIAPIEAIDHERGKSKINGQISFLLKLSA